MARAMVASFLVLMLAFPTVFGTDYTVGDTTGWTLGGDYTTWASGKTFKVGDTLLFNYDSNHALDQVNQNDYSSCSSSNSLKSYQDGNTKISLSSAGKLYFLCPKPGHCSGGMKLAIDVVAASSPPSGSPTTPSGTPTTPSSKSPPESGSPATNTTTSPPPKPNGAATVSNGISLLMGSFFVSAIMFAFMG